jgi:hypothetical protein
LCAWNQSRSLFASRSCRNRDAAGGKPVNGGKEGTACQAVA